MLPIDFNATLAKLPHRGPMCLIDSVVSLTKSNVETLTRVDEKRAKFLASEFGIELYWGIELIAQAGALPLIGSSENGEAHAGVIVQVKSFRAFSSPLQGPRTLTTRCETELLLDGSFASVKGTIYEGDIPLCEAEIMVAIRTQ